MSYMSSRTKFVEQLNKITKNALENGHVGHALKAQELLGRACGYFRKDENAVTFFEIADHLNEMSEIEIEKTLKQIRNRKEEINNQLAELKA